MLFSWDLLVLFLLFVGLGLTFLSYVKKSEYVIYALLVWFPLEPVITRYLPDLAGVYVRYLPEVFLYGIVLIVWLRRWSRSKTIFPASPLDRPFIFFLLAATISFFTNWYYPTEIWLAALRQLLRFVTVFYLVYIENYPRETVKKIVYIGAGMMVFEAVFALFQQLAGGSLDKYLLAMESNFIGSELLGREMIVQFWTAGTRLFATMGRYDRLGSFLALGLIMLLPWLYRFRAGRERWFGFLAFFLGLYVLICTYSRASLIMFSVGAIIIGIILERDRRFAIGLSAVILTAVIYFGGYAYLHPDVRRVTDSPMLSFTERMFESISLSSWQNSYDTNGRFYFIVNTPRIVVASAPFFGVGPGNFGSSVVTAFLNTRVYDRLYMPFGIEDQYGQIDNNWFSIWAETGTVGLVCWFLMFLAVIRLSIKVLRDNDDVFIECLATGLIGLSVAIMIPNFFGPFFELRPLMFYFWLIAGLVAREWRREKEKGGILSKYLFQ